MIVDDLPNAPIFEVELEELRNRPGVNEVVAVHMSYDPPGVDEIAVIEDYVVSLYVFDGEKWRLEKVAEKEPHERDFVAVEKIDGFDRTNLLR